ncbi:MAG: 2-amino-4-hydroxy-6-hydroxymethyldihydropteridine diphosphokinase [Campylobacterota bacterium]|nr:2-amino-4-hydroxy-6-hydroxymethyldihydropteridine diphosphokinase [Campylobacterota bacterium]
MYLKRKLNNNLSIFKSKRFPYSSIKNSKRYKVTVGVGGNIGDLKRRFEHLFVILERDKRVKLLQTSLILKNPPFGYKPQDDFFNSIVILKTDMQPHTFLNYLLRLEKQFGRKRSFANAPRTLDLDIIFFDNRVVKTDKLTIPHIDWSNRESVLVPLKGMKI